MLFVSVLYVGLSCVDRCWLLFVCCVLIAVAGSCELFGVRWVLRVVRCALCVVCCVNVVVGCVLFRDCCLLCWCVLPAVCCVLHVC